MAGRGVVGRGKTMRTLRTTSVYSPRVGGAKYIYLRGTRVCIDNNAVCGRVWVGRESNSFVPILYLLSVNMYDWLLV